MYCHRRNWIEIRVDFLKYQFDKQWSNFGLVKFYKGKKIVQGQWSTSKWEKNNSRSIDMWTSFLEILTWFYGDLHSSILILWQYSSRYNELYNKNKSNKDHNIPSIITTFLHLQVVEITSFTKRYFPQNKKN